MAISTAAPLWPTFLDNGGYTVQPVATPPSAIADPRRNMSATGKSQKLKLFSRGKAISGALSIKGTNQLPNPPINTGITIKKIIRKAWAVITVLYACSPNKHPGTASSVRIKTLIEVPNSPPQMPRIKYNVPICL